MYEYLPYSDVGVMYKHSSQTITESVKREVQMEAHGNVQLKIELKCGRNAKTAKNQKLK